MERLSLIVSAIVAGATAAAQDTASKDPDTHAAPPRKLLREAAADQDVARSQTCNTLRSLPAATPASRSITMAGRMAGQTMSESEPLPTDGLRQDLSGIGYAAVSATGSASIQIINDHCSGPPSPLPVLPSAASAAAHGPLPCPYRGLDSFSPQDAALVLGCDGGVEELQTAIQQHTFLPLLGAFGSGKSLVLLAGLVPRLAQAGHWRYSLSGPRQIRSMSYPWRWCRSMPPSSTKPNKALRRSSWRSTCAIYLRDVLAQVWRHFPTSVC
jgi:hypothetical protein